MAALIVRDHNSYNRQWDANWVNDLAKMMTDGDFRQSGQTYAFYHEDSDLADGGHRLRAQVLSSTTLMMPTFFSMEKADAGVIDTGKKRTAGDAATLAGVINGKKKAELLTTIRTYEKAIGAVSRISDKNPLAIAKEIQRLDALLTRALELGGASLVEVIEPLLDEDKAAKICGILMSHKWPEARIVERLDEIQTSDFADDRVPLAKARQYIESKRPPPEVIGLPGELRVVIKAMLMAESGVGAVNQKREKEIINAIKHPANPEYPSAQTFQDAA
jgi:hypothetical protein